MSPAGRQVICKHSKYEPARLVLQGEMQEALKAIDMGVAAASTEFKAAAKAGKAVVTMSLTVTSNDGGGGDPSHQTASRTLSDRRSSSKALGSTTATPHAADAPKPGAGPAVDGGNLLLAKSPLMQKLAQMAIENERDALAEGRMTNRNGIVYGFVPNAVLEEEANASASGMQEDDPKVRVELTGNDVADEESQFSAVVGAFVAAAQQQKAEIGKRAFRTHQHVRKLALLLGEPSESEAATLFSSVVSLADSFDGAFAKVAGCAR